MNCTESTDRDSQNNTAGSAGPACSLLVCEEILLVGLCERKILFRLKIYDRLRQATAKRIDCMAMKKLQTLLN